MKRHGIIIVEGCDFSGKSTLIDTLAKQLGAIAFKDNQIPPRSMQDALNWLATVSGLAKDRLVVCDRCMLISDPIYASVLGRPSPLGGNVLTSIGPESLHLLSVTPALEAIIWCDPGLEEVKKLSSTSHMEGVVENIDSLHRLYALTAGYSISVCDEAGILHRVYNHTKDKVEDLVSLLDLVSSQPDDEMMDIRHFHDKFNLTPKTLVPTLLSPEALTFRLKALREEVTEFEEAAEDMDVVKMVDALIDLVYFAKGTALMMGVSPYLWSHCFGVVHRANMSKRRARNASESKRGSQLDVVKPENFVPPDTTIRASLETYRELMGRPEE